MAEGFAAGGGVHDRADAGEAGRARGRWVPAFAGMTSERAGMTVGGMGMTVGGTGMAFGGMGMTAGGMGMTAGGMGMTVGGTGMADGGMGMMGSGTCADAGEAGVEGDGPEPAAGVGLDEDVGLVRRRAV